MKSAVSNQQVAPTIIAGTRNRSQRLEAVRREQIHVLPFLFSGKVDNSVTPF